MTRQTPELNDRQDERRPGRRGARRPRRRRWADRIDGGILRSTAALPALFTILNGLAGFGSIHFATKDPLGAATLGNLTIAAWLIVAAMICDMLDGRLARMSRRTSDFGAQLDSLCDIISFGAAPAILMLRAMFMALHGGIDRIDFLRDLLAAERIVWCIAAIYLACAALRLARFNAENEPDESAHMTFKGLPSPGAAAAIVAMVLLFTNLAGRSGGRLSAPWLLVAVSIALPILMLASGLLMVSNLTYTHLVNQYIHGRRSFGYIVKLVLVVVAGLLSPYLTGAVVTIAYVVSGPVRSVWRRRRDAGPPAQPGPDALDE